MEQGGDQDRRFALRGNTSLASDAAHRSLDLRIFGGQWMTDLRVVVVDARQAALNGRDGVAIDECDDVAEDGFRRGRQ